LLADLAESWGLEIERLRSIADGLEGEPDAEPAP
jgi:hypothetical protein